MSNDFQIGKELGELRARLDRLEQELQSHAKCKCGDKSSDILPPMMVHPDDIEALDKAGAITLEMGEKVGEAVLADRCFSRGTTRCSGGYCQGCCGGEWVYLMSNGRRVSCPVSPTTMWNCEGQRYYVGNCRS